MVSIASAAGKETSTQISSCSSIISQFWSNSKPIRSLSSFFCHYYYCVRIPDAAVQEETA